MGIPFQLPFRSSQQTSQHRTSHFVSHRDLQNSVKTERDGSNYCNACEQDSCLLVNGHLIRARSVRHSTFTGCCAKCFMFNTSTSFSFPRFQTLSILNHSHLYRPASSCQHQSLKACLRSRSAHLLCARANLTIPFLFRQQQQQHQHQNSSHVICSSYSTRSESQSHSSRAKPRISHTDNGHSPVMTKLSKINSLDRLINALTPLTDRPPGDVSAVFASIALTNLCRLQAHVMPIRQDHFQLVSHMALCVALHAHEMDTKSLSWALNALASFPAEKSFPDLFGVVLGAAFKPLIVIAQTEIDEHKHKRLPLRTPHTHSHFSLTDIALVIGALSKRCTSIFQLEPTNPTNHGYHTLLSSLIHLLNSKLETSENISTQSLATISSACATIFEHVSSQQQSNHILHQQIRDAFRAISIGLLNAKQSDFAPRTVAILMNSFVRACVQDDSAIRRLAQVTFDLCQKNPRPAHDFTLIDISNILNALSRHIDLDQTRSTAHLPYFVPVFRHLARTIQILIAPKKESQSLDSDAQALQHALSCVVLAYGKIGVKDPRLFDEFSKLLLRLQRPHANNVKRSALNSQQIANIATGFAKNHYKNSEALDLLESEFLSFCTTHDFAVDPQHVAGLLTAFYKLHHINRAFISYVAKSIIQTWSSSSHFLTTFTSPRWLSSVSSVLASLAPPLRSDTTVLLVMTRVAHTIIFECDFGPALCWSSRDLAITIHAFARFATPTQPSLSTFLKQDSDALFEQLSVAVCSIDTSDFVPRDLATIIQSLQIVQKCSSKVLRHLASAILVATHTSPNSFTPHDVAIIASSFASLPNTVALKPDVLDGMCNLWTGLVLSKQRLSASTVVTMLDALVRADAGSSEVVVSMLQVVEQLVSSPGRPSHHHMRLILDALESNWAVSRGDAGKQAYERAVIAVQSSAN
eukprot:c12706_g1_i1.p1 GENE.c12706_g1_i1~~c12706_g1_i1.p1  ORF type:complete len:923 (-),score=172.22 c12706_g1_i1:1733-4501(-)